MSDRVDAVTLTEVIDRCLDLSLDGRLSPKERKKFLVVAKRLRGSLVNLLSARFDEGTAGLEVANEQLTAVNKKLKKETETLGKAADRIADLTKLVGGLDKLIGVAETFL